MSLPSGVSIWLRETRANFLVLSVVLVLIGGAAAFHTTGLDYLLFAFTVIVWYLPISA